MHQTPPSVHLPLWVLWHLRSHSTRLWDGFVPRGRCQRIIPFSGQRRPIVSALHLLAQVVTGFSPLPAVNVHAGVAAVGLAWTLRGGSGAVS